MFNFFRRNIPQLSNGAERFRFYCYYVYGLAVILVIALVIETIASLELLLWSSGLRQEIFTLIFLAFYAEAIIDLVFLILAGIKLFQLSKTLSLTDHFWFEGVKER